MRNVPLCMKQYDYLFHATRIPRIPADHVNVYNPSLNRHVSIAFENRYYVFDCCDTDGNIYSECEILQSLREIVSKHNSAINEEDQISFLTADNRDSWAAQYKTLQSLNAHQLHRLQSSAFLLCLDSTEPSSIEEISRACW